MTCPAWRSYVDSREFCFAPGNPGHVFVGFVETSWRPSVPFSDPAIPGIGETPHVEAAVFPLRVEPRYINYPVPPEVPTHSPFFTGNITTVELGFYTDIPGTVTWSYEHDGSGDVASQINLSTGRLLVPYTRYWPFDVIDYYDNHVDMDLYDMLAYDGIVRVYAEVAGQLYGPLTLTFAGTWLTQYQFT